MIGRDAVWQRFMHADHQAFDIGVLFGRVHSLFEPCKLVHSKDMRSVIKVDEIDSTLDPVVIISGRNNARSTRLCLSGWFIAVFVPEALLFYDGRQQPICKL